MQWALDKGWMWQIRGRKSLFNADHWDGTPSNNCAHQKECIDSERFEFAHAHGCPCDCGSDQTDDKILLNLESVADSGRNEQDELLADFAETGMCWW